MYLNPQDDFDKLDTAIQAGGMAWWHMELPSGVVFFSENKTRMLGYDATNFTHYTHFTDLVHPDDYKAAMQAMTDHLEGRREAYETKYRIKAADGTYKTFYDRGKIVRHEDGNTVIAGVVIDVDDLSIAIDRTEVLAES